MKKEIAKNQKILKAIKALVKQQCRRCGVRYVFLKTPSHFIGQFDEENKVLTIGDKQLINSKVGRVPEAMLGVVMLHEMVHMWQWHRKDKAWEARWSKDPSQALANLILEYGEGEKWYSKTDLIKSAKALMQLEWEAETVAYTIAQSMGLDFETATYMKGAQLYVYNYYLLALSGMWPGYRTISIMRNMLKKTQGWHLTHELADKMIDIMKQNRDNCVTIWEGKACIKRPK